ncbi:MAG: PA0069 family radical SAM protein [Pseudomonadota bacterium]
MSSPPFSARPSARGALSNETGRYEQLRHEAVEDGWDRVEDLPPLRTEVRDEVLKRAISRNGSPDLGFDRSVNPYRGCEHGCVYCYARPSHAHLGLSPGLDFETKLIARPNAPEALARELAKPGYEPAVMALGTNTDPYQPIERDRRIMRGLLDVLQDHSHPVGITTKGVLVERDVDILRDMGPHLCRVSISVTTLDKTIARTLEPRVPSPARRLQAIEKLSKNGVMVQIGLSPIIPGLTDHEVENLLAAGRDAGAQAATMIPLRLPLEVAPLFEEWVRTHMPDRARRVLNQVRRFHGGKLYDGAFGHRMRGAGVESDLLQARFRRAARQMGLSLRLPPLRTDLFHVPERVGDQLSLF